MPGNFLQVQTQPQIRGAWCDANRCVHVWPGHQGLWQRNRRAAGHREGRPDRAAPDDGAAADHWRSGWQVKASHGLAACGESEGGNRCEEPCTFNPQPIASLYKSRMIQALQKSTKTRLNRVPFMPGNFFASSTSCRFTRHFYSFNNRRGRQVNLYPCFILHSRNRWLKIICVGSLTCPHWSSSHVQETSTPIR